MAHQLDKLSAPALRELIDDGVVTVVVPFGSIEYQGGHLPTGADSILADVVGRQVAERLPAVLAPTLRVGCAEQHQDLPATITLLWHRQDRRERSQEPPTNAQLRAL